MKSFNFSAEATKIIFNNQEIVNAIIDGLEKLQREKWKDYRDSEINEIHDLNAYYANFRMINDPDEKFEYVMTAFYDLCGGEIKNSSYDLGLLQKIMMRFAKDEYENKEVIRGGANNSMHIAYTSVDDDQRVKNIEYEAAIKKYNLTLKDLLPNLKRVPL